MSQYKNDPRMITAKFSSIYSKCKTNILKNIGNYNGPSDKEVLCTKYIQGPCQQFHPNAADEDVYNGCGIPKLLDKKS